MSDIPNLENLINEVFKFSFYKLICYKQKLIKFYKKKFFNLLDFNGNGEIELDELEIEQNVRIL